MNLRESKGIAWGAMILIIFLIIITVSLKIIDNLWDLSALFCAFMAIFCHLMALNLVKMSKSAAAKLDIAALIFGILTILAIILIFILYMCEM